MELLSIRIARTIMEWGIENKENGSIIGTSKEGKRTLLRVGRENVYWMPEWDPTKNNDNMDAVIERMRDIGFNFRLEYNKKDKYYNQDHVYAAFNDGKYLFFGVAENKLAAITLALTDSMDFKEALQHEQKHTEVGPNQST